MGEFPPPNCYEAREGGFATMTPPSGLDSGSEVFLTFAGDQLAKSESWNHVQLSLRFPMEISYFSDFAELHSIFIVKRRGFDREIHFPLF